MINKKGWNKTRAYISKMKGNLGEHAFVQQTEFKGKKAVRTGIGSDFRVGKKLSEIKTGHSRLSRRQKATRKKVGSKNYEEVRYLEI